VAVWPATSVFTFWPRDGLGLAVSSTSDYLDSMKRKPRGTLRALGANRIVPPFGFLAHPGGSARGWCRSGPKVGGVLAHVGQRRSMVRHFNWLHLTFRTTSLEAVTRNRYLARPQPNPAGALGAQVYWHGIAGKNGLLSCDSVVEGAGDCSESIFSMTIGGGDVRLSSRGTNGRVTSILAFVLNPCSTRPALRYSRASG